MNDNLVPEEPTRAGRVFYTLQRYTGAALLGCVVFGVLSGHAAHPDVIRLAGSGCAILILAVFDRRAATRRAASLRGLPYSE